MCKIIRIRLNVSLEVYFFLRINHHFSQSLYHFSNISIKKFYESRVCGSIISFEVKISCVSNNNCNFLLRILLRIFACFPVLPAGLHLGVPNRIATLQDRMHKSFISCFFSILMNSCTWGSIISFQGEMSCFFNILMNPCICGSMISFEGEIGMEANDLVQI